MIRPIIIFILVLLILYFYCKLNNIEKFVFNTEIACVDSCILNNGKKDYCIEYCKTCNDNECLYRKNIDLENKPPDIITSPNIKFFSEHIYLSWFKPDTHYKHPILKYIIIIEDNNTNETTVQFITNNNNDLVNHNITGLTNNNTYNFKIFSENEKGKSKPLEMNNVFYPSNELVINKGKVGSKLTLPPNTGDSYIQKIINLFNNKQPGIKVSLI